MNTSDEDLLQLIRAYQQASRQEKWSLVEMSTTRRELIKNLANYEQSGRVRKMNQERLDEILGHLHRSDSSPEEFLPLLEECHFPFEFWNNLRLLAESSDHVGVDEWKERRSKACRIRNEILEKTAYLVNRVRRLNFQIDEERAKDADGNGFLGLIKALDNFTESDGRSFEAYAKVYIFKQIVTYLRNDKLVRPSETLLRFYTRHDTAVEELRKLLHREPTSQEIAEALEIDLEELQDKQDHRTAMTSFDAEFGEDEELNLHDLLGEEAALPYERMENQLLVERLQAAMRGLNSGESAIVNLRWSPFQESELQGAIHSAPEAYQRMRRYCIQRLMSQLESETD